MRLKSAYLVLIILLLGGCQTMDVSDFKGAGPELVLEDYFQGKTKAWGIFEDRFGNLRREFEVEIDGKWDGKTLTLVEEFSYSDGETEVRTWVITKTGEKTYTGTTNDIVSLAQGEAAGNALNWNYSINLKLGERRIQVHFDDWMFLQKSGVLINRARVSKFGLSIGEVSIFFKKPPETQKSAPEEEAA